MTRGLEWSDVKAILDSFQIKYETGPYGFTVKAPVMRGYRDEHEDWRVRCGMIVRIHDGEALSPSVISQSGLERAIREHLAGPVPVHLPRDHYYATKHRTKWQEGHYIWKLKRAFRPGEH